MKKLIVIVALLLLLGASVGFAQERRGWQANDVMVQTFAMQALDSVRVVATWTSNNKFAETFEWRIPELALAGIQTVEWSDSAVVEQPMSDLDAQFCIKTIRDADLKESVETCEPFVVPGVPVLPPDSVRIEIQVVHSDVAGMRWDTVAGANQYWASLIQEGVGEIAAFAWNVYQRDAHCVGGPDHRPTGEFNDEDLEIIDVYT